MSDALDFNAESGDGLPQIGLAPLVDIVLLLICFYLIVMRSIQSHADEPVTLPRVHGAHHADVQPAELVVTIRADGEIRLNGAPMTLDALRSALLLERSRSVDGNGQLRVALRADAEIDFRSLEAVMSASRDAGLPVVTIRAEEGDPR